MPSRRRMETALDWATAALVATAAFVLAYRSEREGPRPAKPQCLFVNPVDEPLALQKARATERGRGRHATSPSRIPLRGWRDILIRTWREIQNDRLMALAGGVVFYSLLALFPAITAGVSLYGLFADTRTLAQHLALAADIVPTSTLTLVGEQVARIVNASDDKLTFGFLFGLALALWSANAGMKAMFDALNLVYDEDEKRGIIKLNAISLLATLCGIALVLVSVTAIVVMPLLLARFGVHGSAEALVAQGRWPALLLVMLIALAALYRFGPSRRQAKWRWLTVGSAFAAAAWLAVSAGFSYYLAHYANYDASYGSLGAVIGLMMWMWLSSIVVLIGAELNSEIEHQTAKDSTVGQPKPLGARGAVMADTVGAAQT